MFLAWFAFAEGSLGRVQPDRAVPLFVNRGGKVPETYNLTLAHLLHANLDDSIPAKVKTKCLLEDWWETV